MFEGIRAYATDQGPAVFRLGDHLKRLERSASTYYMPIPFDRDALRTAVHQVIAANGLTEGCYIRPLVWRGYGVMGLFPLDAPVDVAIAAWEWGAYLGEEGLSTVSGRRPPPGGESAASTTIRRRRRPAASTSTPFLAKIETHKDRLPGGVL